MLVVKDELKDVLRLPANDVVQQPKTLLLVSVTLVGLKKNTQHKSLELFIIHEVVPKRLVMLKKVS